MAKNLDHELEQALRATDDDAARAVVASVDHAGREAPSKASARKNLGLLAGLLGAFVLVIGAALLGFKEAAVYAMPADQVVARTTELAGRRVRVDGVLVPGTLVTKSTPPCEYRFVMKSGETQLPVVYPQCVIPDTFRDRPEGGVEVTVEGTIAAKSTSGAPGPEFQATLVMAKCASKYDPATKEMIESDGTRRRATQSEIEAAGQPVR